jgi:hypothetical protein
MKREHPIHKCNVISKDMVQRYAWFGGNKNMLNVCLTLKREISVVSVCVCAVILAGLYIIWNRASAGINSQMTFIFAIV